MAAAFKTTFKLIAPVLNTKNISKYALRREHERVLKKMTANFERDYSRVSDKFKNHEVSYKQRVAHGRTPLGTPDTLYGATSTDNDIMRWLNDGTDVRYYSMTPGYVSMTIPKGGLSTRPGRGTRWHFTPGGMPGIEPRHFSADVAQENIAEFMAEMIHITGTTAMRFFRGYEIRNP